jgi:hypothetical protein
MDVEIWRPVIGYSELAHVEVSTLGRVRTLDRHAPSCRVHQPAQLRRGRLISPWIGKNGYRYVQIKVGAKRSKYLVHRLVGLSFVLGYFDGATIDHINGDKLDNRPENLRWVSRGRNTALQWQTGLVNIRGERHPSAKLTDEQTRAVPILVRGGMSQSAVARMFGVSASLIYKIMSGKKQIIGTPSARKRSERVAEGFL